MCTSLKECIFCRIAAGTEPSWTVFENAHVCAFLDINPAAKFHTLVIPKNHHENIYDIPDSTLHEMMKAIKIIARTYRERFGIENVQIINSSGKEAQQDVFHVHFHIVPRKKGDGQDIKWKIHPEYTAEYNELIQEIQK